MSEVSQEALFQIVGKLYIEAVVAQENMAVLAKRVRELEGQLKEEEAKDGDDI